MQELTTQELTMQEVQILNDGPYKLMTLCVMGRWTNVLMYRGSIISIWRSDTCATFDAGYADSRRAPWSIQLVGMRSY